MTILEQMLLCLLLFVALKLFGLGFWATFLWGFPILFVLTVIIVAVRHFTGNTLFTRNELFEVLKKGKDDESKKSDDQH